ncbi:hypothetical protein Plhal304r1_c024g0081341 [Plasmopara halstedii]
MRATFDRTSGVQSSGLQNKWMGKSLYFAATITTDFSLNISIPSRILKAQR